MTFASTQSQPKTKVLVIEDVQEMRQLIIEMLKGISTVELVGSASGTVEARLLILRDRPDLVLMDEVLPGESSLDLLNELHQQRIPVVLMTGVMDPRHELPAQARRRITKPGWQSYDQDLRHLAQIIEECSQ